MSGLDDPRNIMGMAKIYANDDVDLDIDNLEKSILEGKNFQQPKDVKIDIAKDFNNEIESFARHFDGTSKQTFAPKMPQMQSSGQSSSNEIKTSELKGLFGDAPTLDAGDDDDEDDDDEEEEEEKPKRTWAPSAPNDPHLSRMTEEERKQIHINRVLGSGDKNDDGADFLREEEEEDEMARILEQIDLLKSNLESEGVDLSRIQSVDQNTSKREAKAVLKILQIKNDRLRYCDMFEEAVLVAAYGLESVFDGKKEYFGSKIDLTGWSESVKVKLRRMRYNTAGFISTVVKDYNVGHGWRIVFEILPSMILYSRDRRLRTNDNLISDDKYKSALRDLGS